MTESGPVQVAEVVARFLVEHGVDRVFGLQGGHIQPIWDRLARHGVRIIDVRDEGSAVHMAHAHTELTGQTAVALVTAGPGVTNTVTAVANASISRIPRHAASPVGAAGPGATNPATAVANASISRIPLMVIGGCPPVPQSNMGPLQDIPPTPKLSPVPRPARPHSAA